MKKIFFIGVVFLFALNVKAQDYSNNQKIVNKAVAPLCPFFYLGLSAGVNNPYGLLGANFDVPIVQKFSLGAGLGLGSWGTKFGANFKYYTKPCCMGWAYGIGFSYAKGIDNFQTSLPTVATNGVAKEVSMNLLPQALLNLNFYHYWRIGVNNRFYLQFGISSSFSHSKYTMISHDVLDDTGDKTVKLLSPGGLSFGLGFQFGSGKM